MPERSFGRTVRYRRTKLGLSQAELGQLVGRSQSTIKSWERDGSAPNDPAVLSTLAAVLDVDERSLFEKAGLELPDAPESDDEATVEQALASLTPDGSEATLSVVPEMEELEGLMAESAEDLLGAEPEAVPEAEPASRQIEPIYAYSTEQLMNTTHVQQVTEVSYMEDRGQRQLYRVRNLATVVILVALVVVFLWSYTNTFEALIGWWETFFGTLRL